MQDKQNGLVRTLDTFRIGEEGIITKVNGEGRIRRRLFDMGVTPGARVLLKKKAPLGDPIEVSIRGYELTLRKSEAVLAEMKVISSNKTEEDGKESK